jgi:hypothetical protein
MKAAYTELTEVSGPLLLVVPKLLVLSWFQTFSENSNLKRFL